MKARYLLPLLYLALSAVGARIMIHLYVARVDQIELGPGLAKLFSIFGLMMLYVVALGVILTVIPVVGWMVARYTGHREMEAGFRYSIYIMLVYWVFGMVSSLLK